MRPLDEKHGGVEGVEVEALTLTLIERAEVEACRILL